MKTYSVDQNLMQGILGALGSMPWNQVNGVMAPLVQAIQAQDQAPVFSAPDANASSKSE